MYHRQPGHLGVLSRETKEVCKKQKMVLFPIQTVTWPAHTGMLGNQPKETALVTKENEEHEHGKKVVLVLGQIDL